MNGTVTFDTLAFSERLVASGVPEDQAKEHARALSDALEAKDLVTKEFLRAELEPIRSELKLIKWMLALVIAVTVLPALKTLFGL